MITFTPRVSRQLTYEGKHAIELTAEERAAESLYICLEVLSWPFPSYTNENYTPPRSHFGWLTAWHQPRGGIVVADSGINQFLEYDRTINYRQTLIYKGYNSDLVQLRIGNAIAAGLEPSWRDQIIVLPLDLPQGIRWLASLVAGSLQPDDTVSPFAKPWGHSPDLYRVDGPPGAVYRWTISRSDDPELDVGAVEDDPGEGGGGGGDGIIPEIPELPPTETDQPLDSPNPNDDAASFFQSLPDPEIEFPFGESGQLYTVNWSESWLAGGIRFSGDTPVEPGTYSYRLNLRAENIPGPIQGIDPTSIFVGSGTAAPTTDVLDVNGNRTRGSLVSSETSAPLPISELARYNQRDMIVQNVDVIQQ